MLENKARFIAQVITGEVKVRSADDVGDTVLTAAEVKAIASGNARVFEHFSILNQCAKLERVRNSWVMTRNALVRKRAVRVEEIALRHRHSADLEVAQQVYAAHAADDFTISIATGVDTDKRRDYTNRDDAGVALERLARHAEAAADARQQTIRCTVGAYRGFTVLLASWSFARRTHVELRLVCEQAGRQTTAYERVLDADVTGRSIISSIDGSLRDLGAHITRNARMDATDAGEIAACDAELERTAVWEHAERYTHLHERLDALTAELRAVTDTSATAPATNTDTAGDTPLPVDTAAVTDAAAEQDVPYEEIVPAGALEVAFVADDIPPAPRSLALLQAPPVEPAPMVFVPDAAPTRTVVTPSPRPRPLPAPQATSTPVAHAPRFGDHTLLRQQRRSATSRSNQPALPPADAATQLDLFAA